MSCSAPSRTAERAETESQIAEAVGQMDPAAREAFGLYVRTLVSGDDRTLDMHALIGEHARGIIEHWEQKFGPSLARKGGLL